MRSQVVFPSPSCVRALVDPGRQRRFSAPQIPHPDSSVALHSSQAVSFFRRVAGSVRCLSSTTARQSSIHFQSRHCLVIRWWQAAALVTSGLIQRVEGSSPTQRIASYQRQTGGSRNASFFSIISSEVTEFSSCVQLVLSSTRGRITLCYQ